MEGLKARPELNGLLGTLVEFIDDKGRWQVRLGGYEDMLLKGMNLVPITRDKATSEHDISVLCAFAECSRESAAYD